MTNASSRIACIRLALPLLVFLALLAPAAVAQAETVTPTCSAQLLYTGYDKVDITYSFDGSGKNASLTLFDAQNGTRQIVAPAPSGSGKTRIGGLTPGVWSLMAVGPDANTTCLTFEINGNIPAL